MTTLKRIGLAILFLPLIFNAGFDASRDYKAHKVKSLVSTTIAKFPGVAHVDVQSCTDVKGHFWLCDVEVQTTDGDKGQQLVPVPYDAIK